MAITTLGNNVLHFSAVDDEILYKVKVLGFYVANGANSGTVEFQTDTLPVYKSGPLNANATHTEDHVGWLDNLKLVSMPTGASVTVQIA